MSKLLKFQLLLKNLYVNLALKQKMLFNIQLKKQLRIYSGVRSILSLPLRGQRTKTNAQTIKKQRKFQINSTLHKNKLNIKKK